MFQGMQGAVCRMIGLSSMVQSTISAKDLRDRTGPGSMHVQIYGASAESLVSTDADKLSTVTGKDLSVLMLTEINNIVKISLCESLKCFVHVSWNDLYVEFAELIFITFYVR